MIRFNSQAFQLLNFCFQFKQYHVLHMVRMREHVYRLYGFYFVFCIEQLQVPCLRGRITAHIHDTFRLGKQDNIHHILMHTGTGGVGDDYIRTAVFVDEILRQHILHIAGKEQRILDAVDFRIDLGVFDGFGHVFDSDNLTRLLGYEVGNGSRARIKVVYQFVACESCEIAGYFI